MEAYDMNHYNRRFRWAAVVLAAIAATLIGFFAYNAGVAHGALTAQLPQGGATPLPPYAWYGWYRPWGFGLFGPFLFIALWFFLLRGLFWGGPWRRYGCSGGGYYGGSRAAFDEWHQRAHERMAAPQQPGGSPHDDNRSGS
jgi:hypothetical protein